MDSQTDAPIMSYSLSELHILYRGNSQYPSYPTFRKWLKEVDGLKLKNRILTPAQVKLIFDKHGRPVVDEFILSQIPKIKNP